MTLMEGGFDLQPVLALLGSLSPPRACLGDSGSDVQPCSAPTAKRRLGDFTAIFQYLENVDSDDATDTDTDTKTPASPCTPPPPTEPRLFSIVKNDRTTRLSQPLPVNFEVEVGGQSFKWKEIPAICSTVPPHVRRTIIIQKLLRLFPGESNSLLCTGIQSLSRPGPADLTAHIFIDNSNILIGFLDAIKVKHGYGKGSRIRTPPFSFPNLCLILERGRAVARKVLVGSTPITPAIDDARALGYECSLLQKIDKESPSPKGKKGSGSSSSSDSGVKKMFKKKGEQAVDEVLNMKILESLLDYPPSTLVLGSGDGALGEFSEGFFKTVHRALNRGWKVELVSFMSNTNNSYLNQRFRRQWADNFVLISLDDFVDELLG